MRLYLAQKLDMLQLPPKQFFRLAHVWKFNRDVDPSADTLEYINRGVIPPYVRDYVHHIQEKEKVCYATNAENK